MKTKENSKIQEKRNELKALSKPIKELVKIGAVTTINEGLKQVYALQGHTEINTLRQWNKKGYSVKKGAKALLLWAEPRKIEKKKQSESEADEMEFFPICFVFSNLQVQKGGAR